MAGARREEDIGPPGQTTRPGQERGLESGLERGTGPETGRDSPGRSRRGLVRGLLVSAGALVVAPVAAVAWSRRRIAGNPSTAVPGATFDETYRGRRISGTATAGTVDGPGAGRATEAGERWHVTVDGRPLHLMRRADGSYLSMVDHYRSYPTALAATRAAVDELGPGRGLSAAPTAPGPEERPLETEERPLETGGRARGVHA